MARSEKGIHYKQIVGISPEYFLAGRFLEQLEQFSVKMLGLILFLPFFLMPEAQTSMWKASRTLYYNISCKTGIMSVAHSSLLLKTIMFSLLLIINQLQACMHSLK